MTYSEVLLVVTLVVMFVLWLVWVWASRLDRLHKKVERARVTLESQLVRRAGVAAEMSGSGLLDPVSSVLVAEAAFEALGTQDWDEPGHERDLLESELSATLRTVLEDPADVAELRADPEGARLLDELAQSWYRVQLSRRFLNEAVAQTQRVRRKLAIRTLHVAGRAPMPQTVEIDDGWPDGLPRSGQQPEGATP